MSRIRTIKPEFCQSETIGGLSRDARLLFIQLWTIVDDSGRTRAASRMLASLLYPYDDDAPKLIGRWLDELEQADCLVRYVVGGSTYLQIIHWEKHQKIDRPSESKLPPPPPFDERSRGLASPREASTTDLGPRTLDMDLGPRTKDRVSDGRGATRPDRQAFFEEFWKAYPKRQGANPKAPAAKLFDMAVKAGADPPAIIAAIRAGVGFDRDKIGSEYIPQAVKWLRDKRWLDHQTAADTTGPPRPPAANMPSHEELMSRYGPVREVDSVAQKSQGEGVLPEGEGLGASESRFVGGSQIRAA